MFEAEASRGFGDTLRFVGFQRLRIAARHRAEPTRPSADVAHNHESRGAARVAFGTIRATGIFANRFELQFAQQMVRKKVLVAGREGTLQPLGQTALGNVQRINEWESERRH
jgi:hypothetical protein